jgi:SAM-dependent methyltransferase
MHSEEKYVENWKNEFFEGKRRKAAAGFTHLLLALGTGAYTYLKTIDSLINILITRKKDHQRVGYCYVCRETSVNRLLENFQNDGYAHCHKILILKKRFYHNLSRTEQRKLKENNIEVWELHNFLHDSVKTFLEYEKWVYKEYQRAYVIKLDYDEFTQLLPKNSSVLDLGSGGDSVGMVKVLVNSGFDVTTFDRVDMVGDEMKFKYLVKFVKGNMFEEVDFPPNTFAGITSILAIFYTEKRQLNEFKSLFDSFQQILKPGGYFLITIGALQNDKFQDIGDETITALKNLISTKGFNIRKVMTFHEPEVGRNVRILAQKI